jgi:hypothetical protein
VINGLVFTIPRKSVADLSAEAKAQRELDARIKGTAIAPPVTSELENPAYMAVRPSVTEHTTHHLNREKL